MADNRFEYFDELGKSVVGHHFHAPVLYSFIKAIQNRSVKVMADNRFEYFDELGKSVVEMGTSALLYKNKDGKIIFLSKDESRKMLEKVTKADEYEAKAKAFDRIVKESEGAFSCGDFCDDVRHIINSYEIGVATDD